MTIHWKDVEQYLTVVLLVLQFYQFYQFCNFGRFALGTDRSERVNETLKTLFVLHYFRMTVKGNSGMLGLTLFLSSFLSENFPSSCITWSALQ